MKIALASLAISASFAAAYVGPANTAFARKSTTSLGMSSVAETKPYTFAKSEKIFKEAQQVCALCSPQCRRRRIGAHSF